MSDATNRSVSRALSILELLATAREPRALKDLAAELDLPKSSALVLLRALEQHEFVDKDDQGRYSVGLRAFEVGSAYRRVMTTARAAADQLKDLTAQLGVTAHFAVLDGDDVIYLAKEDPPDLGVRLASFVGARLPAAVTAVGTAQLAHHPERPELLAAYPDLAKRIRDTLEKGYAVDEGAVLTGVRCVAAPVNDDRGCCGAIGISYLAHSDADIEAIAARVMEAAAVVSTRLGGQLRVRGVA